MVVARSRSALPVHGIVSLALCLCAGTGAAQAAAAKGDPFARYKECLQRRPFTFHTEGRERIAQTRSAKALDQLLLDYVHAKVSPEYARYTIASMCARHFDQEEFLPALAKLREAQAKPVDTWLWAKVLAIECRRVGKDAVVALAKAGKQSWQRAAAMHALGEVSPSGLAEAIVANCAAFAPKDRDGERALLLGAMTAALGMNETRIGDEDFRPAAIAYVNLLAPEVGLPEAHKLQIARLLQRTLRAPQPFVSPEPWLQILKHGEVKATAQSGTAAQPRFFGIESDGERICYVLDLSDSMCKELAPEVRPAGPITGPKKKPPGALLDESDLPWHRIRTRWDLAREQLAISLQRLGPEKHFAVVWFGTESGTLEATRTLVPASRANVVRALAELETITCGRPDPEKAPDGVLRGSTNLHSGLRRAFATTNRGFVEAVAYVDPGALVHGCDTIFVLSDGVPSWDDFHCLDKDYGEGNTVIDSEYGKQAPRSNQIHYWGPFHQTEWLVEDVVRMNAFRRVRVHCIGIGEADQKLLKLIAEAGGGEVYTVGR